MIWSGRYRGPGNAEHTGLTPHSNLALFVLLCVHSVLCCVSLIQVASRQSYIRYDSQLLSHAIVAAAACSVLLLLFVRPRFSFGYFVGFYFYTMILGFIWLDCFTLYNYHRITAALSAAASLLLFLLPALLIDVPLKPLWVLSERKLQHVLTFILVLSLMTIVAASAYNFRIVSLDHIYDYREELYFPAILRYMIGIVSSALLPFAFACYLALNQRWRAFASLLLMLLFYPVTLSKLAFFAPAWMIALVVVSRIFEARIAAVLSILLPMAIGMVLFLDEAGPFNEVARYYFNVVNIRMIAAPASAMDVYNEYFSYHPLTYFCQISFLKPLMHCPYQDPLSVVMQNTYGFGNINASLFATEGVASVGLMFAPLTALICGLVVAVGNRLSAGLPPRFILISGALLPQVFLNVPFTTVLLTHGAVILFLLWYVTPRAIFGPDRTAQIAVAG
jgi:hypothetical protein